MKSIRSILAVALAAAAFLTLPACTSKQESQAVTASAAATSTVKTVTSLLPTAFRAKLAAYIAAHPIAQDLAADTAGALDVAAVSIGKLPTPAVLDSFLLWGSFDPKLAVFIAGFEALYSEFYGTFPADGAALSEIASLIAPPAAVAVKATS